MASKLCCTEEQSRSSSSPELPNARINGATPARQPLLHHRVNSQGSRFTSARTEDLLELRQIFDNAKDNPGEAPSPAKTPRSRLLRPSIYSLQSIHKMKSMHDLIRRKLSKDLTRTALNAHMDIEAAKKDCPADETSTVIQTPRQGPNLQLRITKSDLRKDLLSDKRPDEGGYDSDAKVLDDIAKNIGKKSPLKRPSLHSIDWNSSPGPGQSSQQTPESTTAHTPSKATPSYHVYQLKPSEMASHTSVNNRFSSIFSTPNLRIHSPKKDRKLRRSHSATSIRLPEPSPLSIIRLPSFSEKDTEGKSWGVSTQESLRLSRFPVPSSPLRSISSKSSLRVNMEVNDTGIQSASSIDVSALQIHVQDPTPSPRVSTSIRRKPPLEAEFQKASQDNTGDHNNSSRNSIHLYNMRISQHLRSGSLLSWDQLADGTDLPTPPRLFRERTVSEQSPEARSTRHSRHGRQTSSSGFSSSRVPSKWGKVLTHGQCEDISSIYSSRPHSPPDSLGGSMNNLSRTPMEPESAQRTTVQLPRNFSDNYPTDDDETPKPIKRYGIAYLEAKRHILHESISNDRTRAHSNAADAKKSKFREEFSPSPPFKKSSPKLSIMRMLRPRNSVRSQSDTNLKTSKLRVDGASDCSHNATQRERWLSRSLISLQKEQHELGIDAESDSILKKAWKSNQDERSSFFLGPRSGSLAATTPFRGRRGSFKVRPKSIATLSPLANVQDADDVSPGATHPRASVELGPSDLEPFFQLPKLLMRRSALVSSQHLDDMDPVRKVQTAFDKQMDDAKTVGAWGRYPSHSRLSRTESAGHLDSVMARDFALEDALGSGKGEDSIDPTEHPESPPPIGNKKLKKKIGSTGRMTKSHSMTFSKTFLKNYTKIFRSQSTEFRAHGHGHRSSIVTGGTLEYPELEILPDVWRRVIKEGSSDRPEENRVSNQESSTSAEKDDDKDQSKDGVNDKVIDKGKQKAAEDSMATLQAFKPDASIVLDGAAAEPDTPTDRARVWSVFYEECMPAFPRPSTDMNSISHSNLSELADLHGFSPGTRPGTARHSLDSKQGVMHYHTLPSQLRHHSRAGSRVSRASIASVVPSFVSIGRSEDAGDGGEREGVNEGMSIVSVRRSTMDMIAMYKEQETAERERVLGLMRFESIASRGRS